MSFLFFVSLVCQAPAVEYNFFDEATLVEPPLASPRAPEFALAVLVNTAPERLTAVLGARLPIFNLHLGDLHFQIGADASAWTDLRSVGNGFPLTSIDYLFGGLLMAAYGPFSASVELNHISAHLGDGVLVATQRINYTREGARLLLAYERVFGALQLRAYVGGGMLLHTVPDLPRGSAQIGLELRLRAWTLQPYFATDDAYNGDTGSIDLATQVGVFLLDTQRFTLRFALASYLGSDRRGQHVGEQMQRFSAGLYGRF